MTSRGAYAAAGVDVAAGEQAVEQFRSRLAALGEFGAITDIPAGLGQPLMVTSGDGVGTKTEIARALGRFDTIGQDLVAMCVDDVVCHGARPAYFLDYLAVGHLDPARVATIVRGIAAACDEVGCALVGGETAEHPGLMPEDAFDLAGFCVGFVERDELVQPSEARAGDVIIGLASSGLHANGYSLVRRLIDDGRLPLSGELLTPTRLYAPAVLTLAAELRARGLRFGGFAHVTGGGLARNLPRALADDLGALVRPAEWPMPAVFERLADAASVTGEEMRATFNGGIGFAVVAEPAAVGAALDILADNEVEAWRIGEVRSLADLGGRRYLET